LTTKWDIIPHLVVLPNLIVELFKTSDENNNATDNDEVVNTIVRPKWNSYNVAVFKATTTLILWNHHCSWRTNVRGFRGPQLPMNFHPHEQYQTCIYFFFNQDK
jgi:hypothetical protein